MVIGLASKQAIPWNVPVYYAYDKKYNFYWYSRKNTKHSKLIKQNDNISITIFNSSPTQDDEGGVYISGKASEISENDLPLALKIYFNRAITENLSEKKQLIQNSEDFLGKSILRMYKFIPKRLYVSNEAIKWNGKWIDTRSELTLNSIVI